MHERAASLRFTIMSDLFTTGSTSALQTVRPTVLMFTYMKWAIAEPEGLLRRVAVHTFDDYHTSYMLDTYCSTSMGVGKQ